MRRASWLLSGIDSEFDCGRMDWKLWIIHRSIVELRLSLGSVEARLPDWTATCVQSYIIALYLRPKCQDKFISIKRHVLIFLYSRTVLA
jgi:hypothetical protein